MAEHPYIVTEEEFNEWLAAPSGDMMRAAFSEYIESVKAEITKKIWDCPHLAEELVPVSKAYMDCAESFTAMEYEGVIKWLTKTNTA